MIILNLRLYSKRNLIVFRHYFHSQYTNWQPSVQNISFWWFLKAISSGLLLKLSRVHFISFDNNNLTISRLPIPAAKCNTVNFYLFITLDLIFGHLRGLTHIIDVDLLLRSEGQTNLNRICGLCILYHKLFRVRSLLYYICQTDLQSSMESSFSCLTELTDHCNSDAEFPSLLSIPKQPHNVLVSS